MKKVTVLLFCAILIPAYFFCQPGKASASSFNNAYIRLDNQISLAPLSGTICAQPSSATSGIEANIAIAFPTGFVVSSSDSDWTTNVTNIPQGSTPWPGIGGTANSVTGTTVTFASSDLTLDTQYCFNFAGGNSTTGATGDDQKGTITTEDSSNNTIDSSIYALSIDSNDQIKVTASIAPSVSDLPITLVSTTPGTQFPQNSVISYEITYGSNTADTIPLTIQAQWSQGTIEGSPAPSVDILDYVVGSASNAYGSTPAVIDPVNGTITWAIPSFPGNTTNQTVSFSLKTNSSYTGPDIVSFTVSARAISGSTVTPDQTITQEYLYASNVTPTPTPVPTSSPSTPTSTSTTSTTTTPSPTPLPNIIVPLYFSNISIQSISQSNAQILIETNNNANLTVQYGTNVNSLTQTIKTLVFQTQNLINLDNLNPDTDYYFRISATDESGNTIKSDIFTFRTAVVSQAPTVNPQTLVITSNNSQLLNQNIRNSVLSNLPQLKQNIIVIPESTVFEVQFALNKYTLIKSIQAIVRNKNVLGLNTTDIISANSNFVDVVETEPGVYTGRLESMPNPGFYEIYVRAIDYNGNITEQKIADLTVTSKFEVYEKNTDFPVEGARVLLYLDNDKTRIYQLISPQILPITNPVYTLLDGSLNTVLSFGKYRADISAIGYDSTTVYFQITPTTVNYPAVYLQKQPFSIVTYASFLANVFIDQVNANQQYLQARAASNNLFDFMAFVALVILVFSVFLSFSARTHIPLLYTPYFLVYKIKLLFNRTRESIVFGKVIDEVTKNPVSRVNVHIQDSKDNRIIANLKTNKLGEFYFNRPINQDFDITVVKTGYLALSPLHFTLENPTTKALMINVKRDKSFKRSIIELTFLYAEDLFGILLEFFLILSLFIQFFFIYTFGFIKIAPFLVISTINILVFFLFLYKPKNLED